MTMSLAVLLKELGFSPTEIAWRTLQADILYKAEPQEIVHWNGMIDAMGQEHPPVDPVEWFMEKHQGMGLPEELKKLLIKKNPAIADTVNAIRSINEEAARRLMGGTSPDDIPYWGHEGDPRKKAPAPDIAEEAPEEPKQPEEDPAFGPEGANVMDNLVDFQGNEPAVPAAEVERDVPEVFDPAAERAQEGRLHEEAHEIDPAGRHEERPPVRNEEQEEQEAQEGHDIEMIQRLVQNSPQQAMTSYFIKNFGHNYNRIANEKGHIDWSGATSDRIDDIHSLPQETHDRLVQQTFDEMKDKLRQPKLGIKTYIDKHTGDEKQTKGRANPFLGKIDAKQTQRAVIEALSMAKISGRSLAEAAVKGAYGGNAAVGKLAQTLHHEMLVGQHITGLQDKIDAAEEQQGGHGAGCPDCQMGHNSIFYHHNRESQWAAGAPMGGGGKHEGAASYVNPRRLIGTGRITPDFQNMGVMRLRAALEIIEDEPVGYKRGKNKYSMARDLEHYYTTNRLPWNLKMQLDDPEGLGTNEQPRISGVRVPQTLRIGDIRKPAQEDIRTLHGTGIEGETVNPRSPGNVGDPLKMQFIPAMSSGFVFPGEFHSPNMFQFGGGQDYSQMVQSAASSTGQTDMDDFNAWIQQSLAASKEGATPPVTPAQQNNDFVAMTQQMGGQMFPQSSEPEPMADPYIQPLPPMQKDAILPQGEPLSEEQVRSYEHLGKENNITPLNWTGGPTKCTVCAGHGKVALQRATNYARATDRDREVGDEVSGMTDEEVRQWVMQNYRPAGEQGSFHEVTERDLEVFGQQTGGQKYDPDDEHDVRFMQGTVQNPTGKDIACPHCDAPHPLMEEGHSAATGVCPTCIGDNRLHHAAGELGPLIPHGEETKRPNWLKPGRIGQERMARAEYEKYVHELQEKQRGKIETWKEKIEPHFTRYLDHSLTGAHGWLGSKVGGDDVTKPAASLSAATGTIFENHETHQHKIIERLQSEAEAKRRPPREGRFQVPSPQTVEREDLVGEGGIMSDVEAAGGLEALHDPPTQERMTRPDRLISRIGPGGAGPGQQVRLPKKQIARFNRMQAAALEASNRQRFSGFAEGFQGLPDDDMRGIESLHGTGKLSKVGPMHMTALEYLREFGRPPPEGTEWVGEYGEEGIHGEPVSGPESGGPHTGKPSSKYAKFGKPGTRTVLDDATGKRNITVPRDPKRIARDKEIGTGGPPQTSRSRGVSSKYANEIRNLMKEREKVLGDPTIKHNEKRAQSLEMANKIEDYMNNPNSPAENNPISTKTIHLPNKIAEKLLHWDPHTRKMVGQHGKSHSYLSPFHRKMKELDGTIQERIMDEWKKNHAEEFGGKGGIIIGEGDGTYQASDSDRAWNDRKRDGPQEMLGGHTFQDVENHLRNQIRVEDDEPFDIHAMPSAPVDSSPTAQHKEFWLAQLGHLAQMAKNTDGHFQNESDQHHAKTNDWLLKNEPNRMWQAVLRSQLQDIGEIRRPPFTQSTLGGEGPRREPKDPSAPVGSLTGKGGEWLRDTMHDIWEHHPGWVPYSLAELKDWQQKNQPEPLERAFTSLLINRLMSDILVQ